LSEHDGSVFAAIRRANATLTYAANRQPVRWAVTAGVLLALVWWLLTARLLASLAFGTVYAIATTLVRRSDRGKRRFTRWAEQHPEPRG
jgi:hypothetical protein